MSRIELAIWQIDERAWENALLQAFRSSEARGEDDGGADGGADGGRGGASETGPPNARIPRNHHHINKYLASGATPGVTPLVGAKRLLI